MNFQFSAEKNVMNYKQQLLDDHSSSEWWIKLKESEIKYNEAQNQIVSLNDQIKKQELDLNDKSMCYHSISVMLKRISYIWVDLNNLICFHYLKWLNRRANKAAE